MDIHLVVNFLLLFCGVGACMKSLQKISGVDPHLGILVSEEFIYVWGITKLFAFVLLKLWTQINFVLVTIMSSPSLFFAFYH